MNTPLKTFLVIVVATVAAVPTLTVAQNTAASKGDTGYKIGIVDRKLVFDQYTKQKEGLQKLENEKSAHQKTFDTQMEAIKADRDRLTGNTSLPEDQKTELRDKIESAMREYEAEFKRVQGDLYSKSRKHEQAMAEDINAAIQAIGETENYHLILEGNPAASTVVFFSNAVDVTDKVVTKLNGAK